MLLIVVRNNGTIVEKYLWQASILENTYNKLNEEALYTKTTIPKLFNGILELFCATFLIPLDKYLKTFNTLGLEIKFKDNCLDNLQAISANKRYVLLPKLLIPLLIYCW